MLDHPEMRCLRETPNGAELQHQLISDQDLEAEIEHMVSFMVKLD